MTTTGQPRLGHRQRQLLDLLDAADELGMVDGLTGPQLARALEQSYRATADRLVKLHGRGLVEFHRIDPPPPHRPFLVWHLVNREENP